MAPGGDTWTSAGPAGEIRRGPGERAGLSRHSILEAARGIVEREGLAALTMRRLAEHLGVRPNAIYSHFTDKSALIDALLDDLIADVPVPARQADWAEGIVDLMRATRSLLLAHAELIPLFLSRPMSGPNAMRLGEVTLKLLERAGLRGQDAIAALRILLVYAFGFAAQEAPRLADPEPGKRQADSKAAFQAAGDLPKVSQLADDLSRHPGDETFDKGLKWLIAGIKSGDGG